MVTICTRFGHVLVFSLFAVTIRHAREPTWCESHGFHQHTLGRGLSQHLAGTVTVCAILLSLAVV